MFGGMPNAASRSAAVGRAVEVGAFDFTADGVTPLPLAGVMQPTHRTEFPLEWRLPAYTGWAVVAHPLATPSIPAIYAIPAAGLSRPRRGLGLSAGVRVGGHRRACGASAARPRAAPAAPLNR